MSRILIDTRIWALALKAAYMERSDPDYGLAIQAKDLVSNALEREQLLMSAQLVGEIYHVATRRGLKVPPGDVVVYLDNLLSKKNVLSATTSKKALKRAMRLSVQHNLHIWDFLVAVPFEGNVDVIYTMDPHFRAPYFQGIAKVENPLGVWKVEGQR